MGIMGERYGHVILGLGFMLIGLCHLRNHTKIHATRQTFKSRTWFPSNFSRYLELYSITLVCSTFTFIELRLAPFDVDGSFKATHLHHIEHACIAIAFTLHALFAILLDKLRPKHTSNIDISHFIAAMAFTLEFLIFHFHTTDHVGLEGQYHWLLQQLILVCLIFTLLSIWLPNSFMVAYIRSIGVTFKGSWLIVMGYMLWTPEYAPKGCSLHEDRYGRDVIECNDQESLHRAKALVNILFSFFFIGMMCFGVISYLCVHKIYEVNEYELVDVQGNYDIEDEIHVFLHGKRVQPVDFDEEQSIGRHTYTQETVDNTPSNKANNANSIAYKG